MGVDIHTIVEVKKDGKWIEAQMDVFGWRSYAIFGFLANIRNYSESEYLTNHRGFPDDSEYLNEIPYPSDSIWAGNETNRQWINQGDYFGKGYLLLSELLAFDYNKTFWDRRITKPIMQGDRVVGYNGAARAEEGEGQIISYKEHLGQYFFDDLDKLKTLGEPENVRVIFYFDC
jgi:hypothetical protein